METKPALKDWYETIYSTWNLALAQTQAKGLRVELGAGAGFSKLRVPGIVCTDALPYEGLDQVADAQALPWEDKSLQALFMLNVFHHLPDVGRFLAEAERVLAPGALLVISDQHPGFFAAPILRWIHHEPFDPRAREWRAQADGPLAGANGSLVWMVFKRDVAVFEAKYSGLELVEYRTFAPLQYWLAGGLKRWSLVPAPFVPFCRWLDSLLLKLSPNFGSFVHVTLRKKDL